MSIFEQYIGKKHTIFVPIKKKQYFWSTNFKPTIITNKKENNE